jgi:hypothetical protein
MILPGMVFVLKERQLFLAALASLSMKVFVLLMRVSLWTETLMGFHVAAILFAALLLKNGKGGILIIMTRELLSLVMMIISLMLDTGLM